MFTRQARLDLFHSTLLKFEEDEMEERPHSEAVQATHPTMDITCVAWNPKVEHILASTGSSCTSVVRFSPNL